MTTQLYATIKKSSKYAHQNEVAKGDPEIWGLPFPVEVRFDTLDYHVRGGPGGQYRLADVHLFAKSGDKLIKLK